MMIVSEIAQIFNNYKFDTEILVASIRHPVHVVEAAKIGAHIVTLPPEILGKMMLHPLTDKGLSSFLTDWEKISRQHEVTF
jgi:transaldolase